MSKDLFGPIELANGVRWNPSVNADTDADTQALNAVIDLVICLRGGTPNLDLGNADKFLFTGEYNLALRDIKAVIAAKTDVATELNDIALARAIALVEQSENKILEGGYVLSFSTVRDLVISLRADNPNLHLYGADEYLWAGEDELVLDEVEDIIAKDTSLVSELTQAIFTRAIEQIRI